MGNLRRILGGTLALLLITGEASAQDILQMFLPGGPEYRLIGGNPFSSVRSDANGSSGIESKAFVRYDGRIDNYYSELRTDGTAPRLGGRLHSLSLQLPLKSGARVGLAAQSRELLSEARNTSDQLMNYDNSLKLIRLSYETPLFGSTSWNLILGHSNASGALLQDVGTSIAFRAPIGSLALNVERSTSSQELNIAVAGVQGLLPLDHQSTEVSVRLQSEGENPRIVMRGFQKAISPIPDGANRHFLRFSPGGIVLGWESLLEAPLGSSWKGMVSFSGLAFNGAGTFSAAGSQYGLLGHAAYRDISAAAGLITVGPSGSMFVADCKYIVVEGSFDGYAESWPFVSAMESLFSQRGNFQVTGSFRLAQIHAGGMMPVASWLELGGGLTAMRMTPALRVESWQAGLFGTGRRGYSDRRLSIDQVDGAMLSGGLRVHVGKVRVDYSISQFIPVTLHKSAPTGGTKDLFTPALPGAVVRSWGGLFQSMSVEVEM